MENITPTHWVRTNVRRLRTEKGLTLADLSERMTNVGHPLTLNVLSRIESTDRAVDVDDLVGLAAALEVPVTQLLDAAEDENLTAALAALYRWTVARVSYASALAELTDIEVELAAAAADETVRMAVFAEAAGFLHPDARAALERAIEGRQD